MKHDLLLKAKNSFAANFSYAVVIHHEFIIDSKPMKQQRIL